MNNATEICKIETFLNQAINESFMARNDRDQINVVSNENIESGLKNLVKTRRDLMAQLFEAKGKIYKRDTQLNIAKEDNEILINVLESNLESQHSLQNEKTKRITNDIMTQNKQLQITENEFRKKNYYIFIWKHITAFSILSLLTTLFLKTNHISSMTAYTTIVILFVCLLIVLVINHYIFKKRNVIYFNKYNWKSKAETSQQGVCEA